jgi:tetratricopeptide (TPR) repeat protein
VHLGRSGEALSVADRVIHSDPRTARVAAVFRIRRGRALAQMGERARALSEHDRAQSMLSNGNDRDPDWTWWVDRSELAWHRAVSLASLCERPAAVELFQQALDLRPPSAHRARYNDDAHLLEAQVAVRAWHDAEAIIAQVLARADDVNSSRTSALLRRIAASSGRATPFRRR